MGSFFTVTAQNQQKPARPITSHARRPHPGRNLGLGRQSPARPRARLGRDTGLFDLGHPFWSDGRAHISLRIKAWRRTRQEKP